MTKKSSQTYLPACNYPTWAIIQFLFVDVGQSTPPYNKLNSITEFDNFAKKVYLK